MKIPDEFMAPDRGHEVGHHLQPQPQPQNSYRRGSLEDSKPSFKVLRALKFKYILITDRRNPIETIIVL